MEEKITYEEALKILGRARWEPIVDATSAELKEQLTEGTLSFKDSMDILRQRVIATAEALQQDRTRQVLEGRKYTERLGEGPWIIGHRHNPKLFWQYETTEPAPAGWRNLEDAYFHTEEEKQGWESMITFFPADGVWVHKDTLLG